MTENNDLRPAMLRDRPDNFSTVVRPGPAIYQGERPVVPEVIPAEAVIAQKSSSKFFREKGLTPREARFVKSLQKGFRSRSEAVRDAFPKIKNVNTINATGRRLWQSIAGKMDQAELNEILGIGYSAIALTVKHAMEADVVKAFIDTKTGAIVESRPYVDYPTRLSAARTAAQLGGHLKEKEGVGSGQVVVNVINYAPPGSPAWPGGGRG